jgi:ketosteroid isomerase-like protein
LNKGTNINTSDINELRDIIRDTNQYIDKLPNGKPINLTGNGTVVLRQQSDGSWLMVIENPWGTD